MQYFIGNKQDHHKSAGDYTHGCGLFFFEAFSTRGTNTSLVLGDNTDCII